MTARRGLLPGLVIAKAGRAAVLVATLVALAVQAAPAGAQEYEYELPVPPDRSHLQLLAVNAALGGLTAGLGRWLSGDGFLDGVGPGVLGGAVAFGGKRIAASRSSGAGLAGRQVHALGTSFTANGASGRGLLDSVVVPVGPLRIDVGRDPGPAHPRVRLSLADALATAWAVGTSDLTFDPRASLSSGALVFDARNRTIEVGDSPVLGAVVGGVILVSGLQQTRPATTYRNARAETLRHERVHVLQHDFAERVWTGPLERGLLGRLPGGGRVPDRVETDLLLTGFVAAAAAFGILDSRNAPWESEARRLAGPVEFR